MGKKSISDEYRLRMERELLERVLGTSLTESELKIIKANHPRFYANPELFVGKKIVGVVSKELSEVRSGKSVQKQPNTSEILSLKLEDVELPTEDTKVDSLGVVTPEEVRHASLHCDSTRDVFWLMLEEHEYRYNCDMNKMDVDWFIITVRNTQRKFGCRFNEGFARHFKKYFLEALDGFNKLDGLDKYKVWYAVRKEIFDRWDDNITDDSYDINAEFIWKSKMYHVFFDDITIPCVYGFSMTFDEDEEVERLMDVIGRHDMQAEEFAGALTASVLRLYSFERPTDDEYIAKAKQFISGVKDMVFRNEFENWVYYDWRKMLSGKFNVKSLLDNIKKKGVDFVNGLNSSVTMLSAADAEKYVKELDEVFKIIKSMERTPWIRYDYDHGRNVIDLKNCPRHLASNISVNKDEYLLTVGHLSGVEKFLLLIDDRIYSYCETMDEDKFDSLMKYISKLITLAKNYIRNNLVTN